jgi:hypothetical protein
MSETYVPHGRLYVRTKPWNESSRPATGPWPRTACPLCGKDVACHPKRMRPVPHHDPVTGIVCQVRYVRLVSKSCKTCGDPIEVGKKCSDCAENGLGGY